MKFSFIIPLILVEQMSILCWCEAVIIVKWHHLRSHFIRMREAHTGQSDILTNFELYSRQVLCDYVIRASQFLGTRYGFGPTKFEGQLLKSSWVSDLQTLNYQRSTPTLVDPDPEGLKYTPREVEIGARNKSLVNTLPCVIFAGIEWYVTYGFVEKFLYLIEPINGALRPTALIELSAEDKVLDAFEKLLNYFAGQVISKTSRDLMEVVCKLDQIDLLRLCGAVFEVLLEKGYLIASITTPVNYIQLDAPCQGKFEVNLGLAASFRARPCTLNDGSIPLFYVLADCEEPHSVFVLAPVDTRKSVKLITKITKVGALMHPTSQAFRVVKDEKELHGTELD